VAVAAGREWIYLWKKSRTVLAVTAGRTHREGAGMSHLSEKSCIPCRGGIPPLTREQIEPLHSEIPDWDVEADHHLVRNFRFVDFAQALAFVNRVGELAEGEGHHPDIHLGYGKVRIELWSHKVDGLTESDFILAAKIDRLS
jgi:4a-hydroxytetrahydrobiopterin dehydratase